MGFRWALLGFWDICAEIDLYLKLKAIHTRCCGGGVHANAEKYSRKCSMPISGPGTDGQGSPRFFSLFPISAPDLHAYSSFFYLAALFSIKWMACDHQYTDSLHIWAY